MHIFFRFIHFLTFQNAKWATSTNFVPNVSTIYGNLLEEEYIAPEVHSLYKAFCLGMRHQSKTPYWTRKLETYKLESLRKRILNEKRIGTDEIDFDDVIDAGNVFFRD